MVDFSDLDDLDSAPVRPDRTAGQPQPAGTAPAIWGWLALAAVATLVVVGAALVHHGVLP